MNPLLREPNPHAGYIDQRNPRSLLELRARYAVEARFALQRLVQVMQHQTGQGVKLRGLLRSLWRTDPADLSDLLCLDFHLREDLVRVQLGWGFESPGHPPFFYDALKAEVEAAGLWDWFLAV